MQPKTISGREVMLADIVRLDTDKFCDAIVCNIQGTEITLRRPYMAHDDFSYTGGVITYIGLEEFKVSNTQTFTLVARSPTLK